MEKLKILMNTIAEILKVKLTSDADESMYFLTFPLSQGLEQTVLVAPVPSQNTQDNFERIAIFSVAGRMTSAIDPLVLLRMSWKVRCGGVSICDFDWADGQGKVPTVMCKSIQPLDASDPVKLGTVMIDVAHEADWLNRNMFGHSQN